MTRFAAALLVLCGIGLIGFAVYRNLPRDAPQATAVPGTQVFDFTLTERTGQPFHSRELEGKVWIASFFFVSCPSACWQQNQIVQQLQNEFGEQGVRFVSISCDPENDTPDRLSEYARKLYAKPGQWFFLTGDLTYIRLIGRDAFQMPVDKQTHANRLLLMDKWGHVRGRFAWQDESEMRALKKQMQQLLDEKEPPARPQA